MFLVFLYVRFIAFTSPYCFIYILFTHNKCRILGFFLLPLTEMNEQIKNEATVTGIFVNRFFNALTGKETRMHQTTVFSSWGLVGQCVF